MPARSTTWRWSTSILIPEVPSCPHSRAGSKCSGLVCIHRPTGTWAALSTTFSREAARRSSMVCASHGSRAIYSSSLVGHGTNTTTARRRSGPFSSQYTIPPCWLRSISTGRKPTARITGINRLAAPFQAVVELIRFVPDNRRSTPMQIIRYRSATGKAALGVSSGDRSFSVFFDPFLQLHDLLLLHAGELRSRLEEAVRSAQLATSPSALLAPIDCDMEGSAGVGA